MKKIVMVLMKIMPFMTLIGGYIFCSDIYYNPYLKAGVVFELFVQPGIYFSKVCYVELPKCRVKSISQQ